MPEWEIRYILNSTMMTINDRTIINETIETRQLTIEQLLKKNKILKTANKIVELWS